MATTVLPAADILIARLSARGLTTPDPVPSTVHAALLQLAGSRVRGDILGASLAGAARRHLGLPFTPYNGEERARIDGVLAVLLTALLPDMVRAVVDNEQAAADAMAAIR
ncbi:hypothetical protein [Streptomyces sp. DW26H14]|uniref:hypothetical protein n=1 Tax=Streptomyces sp. DW26H14 TaxID=3435395 RepID=UPI00403DFC6A